MTLLIFVQMSANSSKHDCCFQDAVGPEVAVGARGGADDDPITNSTDKPYLGEPDDPPIQMYGIVQNLVKKKLQSIFFYLNCVVNY